MGSSSSCCSEKARETRDFLLRDVLPNYKNILVEVSENSIEAGDIVLFNMQSSSNAAFSFKHAVVYCGDGEVIHFHNINNSSAGLIRKEGFQLMRQKRGKGKVLRKKDGINPETFNRKVKELMNSTAKYNLFENNCINFALYLLDLGDFSFQSQKSLEEELESLIAKLSKIISEDSRVSLHSTELQRRLVLIIHLSTCLLLSKDDRSEGVENRITC
ncbi:uncharacterized protein LOC122187874 isoform X1 [Lagopus leucura]|uniref:uncharacterized protein LOC122187874 isoform X1 n=1 Tax=Lagopus leucura TaxID=30410 RepID=UPI001C677E4B|nr:uncharacterized protein LOC122187874 isoform X1 [Lagopus leucura]XP_042741665.1 uncharacterized protein LOC122187874 isoform X1 [Lagopus leucura]